MNSNTINLPDAIHATARYAVVVGGDVYDLSSVSLEAITSWYSGEKAIGLVDAAGSHLGRLSPRVGGFEYMTGWKLHDSTRFGDADRVRGAVANGSALLTFDPLAA